MASLFIHIRNIWSGEEKFAISLFVLFAVLYFIFVASKFNLDRRLHSMYERLTIFIWFRLANKNTQNRQNKFRKNMPNKWWRRQQRKLKHIRINGHFLLASRIVEDDRISNCFHPKSAIYTERHGKRKSCSIYRTHSGHYFWRHKKYAWISVLVRIFWIKMGLSKAIEFFYKIFEKCSHILFALDWPKVFFDIRSVLLLIA